MTIQTQVSVLANTIRPRDYDVFGGLDVDHHSIAATFTDHDRLLRSLRLPYRATVPSTYKRSCRSRTKLGGVRLRSEWE